MSNWNQFNSTPQYVKVKSINSSIPSAVAWLQEIQINFK
jgi:hypothetical protein